MKEALTLRELQWERWRSNLARSPSGAPLVDPLFVVEQGPILRLVDIRPRAEAEGVIGHIPGSIFLSPAQLAEQDLGDGALVILCADGRQATEVAHGLERAGRGTVAALAGGIAAWRRLGLTTIRAPLAAPPAPPTPAPTAALDTTGRRLALTRAEVEAHIGDPRMVRWIRYGFVLGMGRCSCVDGRDERGVVGTPGGDAGEFLLLLAAIEQASGRTIADERVRDVLLSRIDAFGDLYLHTDATALEALMETARQDAVLGAAAAKVTDLPGLQQFIRRPPEKHRQALLALLTLPDHIGCGHIRLMLQHPEEYGVRRGLVLAFLRAAWELLWAGAPEIYVTALGGGHEEAAVVNVRLEEEILLHSRIPLVSPFCGGRQMFVNHPQVATALREAVLDFLTREHPEIQLPPEVTQALSEIVPTLAARQLKATLGHLAEGLPVYDVLFRRDGSFRVTDAGD